VAVALCADQAVPDWVRAKLRQLPKEMEESDRLAHQFEGAVVSLVEAGALSGREGEEFRGVVTSVDRDDHSSGSVMLEDPAVEASLTGRGDLPLGTEVSVWLVEANPETRTVRFELA
jgi:exoribonuclease R